MIHTHAQESRLVLSAVLANLATGFILQKSNLCFCINAKYLFMVEKETIHYNSSFIIEYSQ